MRVDCTVGSKKENLRCETGILIDFKSLFSSVFPATQVFICTSHTVGTYRLSWDKAKMLNNINQAPCYLAPAKGPLSTLIVSRMVQTFAYKLMWDQRREPSGCGHLSSSSITELLSLRLVCKAWSSIEIPICFAKVKVETWKQAQALLSDGWKSLLSSDPATARACPVRHLTLNNLWLRDDSTNNEQSLIPQHHHKKIDSLLAKDAAGRPQIHL